MVFPLNYKKGSATINNIASSVNDEEEDFASEEVQPTSSFGLTKEQYQQVMALLQQSHIKAAASNPSQPHSLNQNSTQPSTSQTNSGNYSALSIKSATVNWILDSGATNHICCSLSSFSSYHSITPVIIKLPNGSQVSASIADIIIFSKHLYLDHVLYLPNFSFNLISVAKLSSSFHCTLAFIDHFCDIQETHTLRRIGYAKLQDGLYVLRGCTATPAPAGSVHNISTTSTHLWHSRLGHRSHKKLYTLYNHFPFISVSECNNNCTVCPLAKQKRLPYKVSNSRANAPFDLLHIDIWGPNVTQSLLGHRYFLTIVDDYSRHTWVIFMKHKSESTSHTISFVHMVETQFSCKVKTIKIDNGPEFHLNNFFSTKGIIHQTSCMETTHKMG